MRSSCDAPKYCEVTIPTALDQPRPKSTWTHQSTAAPKATLETAAGTGRPIPSALAVGECGIPERGIPERGIPGRRWDLCPGTGGRLRHASGRGGRLPTDDNPGPGSPFATDHLSPVRACRPTLSPFVSPSMLSTTYQTRISTVAVWRGERQNRDFQDLGIVRIGTVP